MKKCLITCFLFLSILCSGQRFAISNDSQNIFYLGLNNPISIAVERIAAKMLIVKTNNGTITKEEPGHYNYHPERIGRSDIIIYQKINNHLKEIGRNSFRIKEIPIPVFIIGPSPGGNIEKITLRNQEYVRAEFEGGYIDARAIIDSFTMCVLPSDTCLYKEIKNYGEKLNEAALKAISIIKEGDTIIFKNIYTKMPDESQVQLMPVFLTVTN